MDLELPTFSETTTTKCTNSKRQPPPKNCAVCQGKATGHHYDVPSCNGCKSFFRRVSIEKPFFICKKVEKCYDDLKPDQTTPKCRFCRFKKCVEVGMNPMGIQMPGQLEPSNSKIEKPSQTIDTFVANFIDRMLKLDAQSEKFRDCSFNPKHFPSLKECMKQTTSSLSIADKYDKMQGWPIRPETSSDDRRKISKHWMLYELLTQIELAKALPFYRDLSESDRYLLAQGTVLMSSNLTKAFYSFEQKCDKLMRPDGIGYYDNPFFIYEEFRPRFRDDIGMRCLSAILRNGLNRIEFVLLKAMVLTNPGVPDLSEDARNCLIKERHTYNAALFRYIMAQHGASGPARFATILGFIDILEHQQRDHRNLSSFINLTSPTPHRIPLIDEIMKH